MKTTKNNQDLNEKWNSLHGIMVKLLECGIVVRKFEPHSRYDVHFMTYTIENGMSPVILQPMG